ncbi:unnamed protein product [Dracunculus medinensis]|uniref:ADF-H domain-containing protein n=1 Tax=Dracunculus medinensis TaxID=318479 RepID=A0A0N4UMH6_DRAME|nr:unnamed protein product [Dracunculus medinensis]
MSTFQDCTIEEICDELPSQQPRFILISFEYNHTDGRVSLPLCFVFYTPDDLQMLYAGSRNHFVSECELTKNFEIRDAEELTQELLNSKMA